jgi:predicted transcriptional regulator
MLEALFGNRTAAAVLIFIGVNREAYAQEISDKVDISLNLVQAQLRRLERGGVLVSRPRGRMRFYSINPRFVFAQQLGDLLRQTIDYMPDKEQDRYIVRRRPRAPGKPL